MLTHENLRKHGWKDFRAVLKNAYTDKILEEKTIFARDKKAAHGKALLAWGVDYGGHFIKSCKG